MEERNLSKKKKKDKKELSDSIKFMTIDDIKNTANFVFTKYTTDLLKYSEKWLFGIFIFTNYIKLNNVLNYKQF